MARAQQQVSETDLIERAKELVPLVIANADAAEAQGQLTDEVVEALHNAGLYGMWVPRSLGGSEVGIVAGSRIIETLSYGDPSTGWVQFVAAVIAGSAGAFLGDAAVEEMFPGDRAPLGAGQGTRPGIAIPVDGGYSLTGSWSFGSGMKHAAWTHSLGIIEGSGEVRIFTGRVADAELKWDSWDTLGLRATGSIDYSMDSVYIPEAFTHSGSAHWSPRGGALYKLGIIGIISAGHGAWALGVARRMLDELNALALTKAGRAGADAASDAFLERFGDAEAKLRSARALFYETWNGVEETLNQGNDLSPHQQTLMRLAMTNATWSSHDVANIVFDATASTALRSGTIQRLFRDMKTGAQHVTSSPAVRQRTARMLAGLGEGKRWLFLDLVDDVQS